MAAGGRAPGVRPSPVATDGRRVSAEAARALVPRAPREDQVPTACPPEPAALPNGASPQVNRGGPSGGRIQNPRIKRSSSAGPRWSAGVGRCWWRRRGRRVRRTASAASALDDRSGAGYLPGGEPRGRGPRPTCGGAGRVWPGEAGRAGTHFPPVPAVACRLRRRAARSVADGSTRPACTAGSAGRRRTPQQAGSSRRLDRRTGPWPRTYRQGARPDVRPY